jgi:hypothetical protein
MTHNQLPQLLTKAQVARVLNCSQPHVTHLMEEWENGVYYVDIRTIDSDRSSYRFDMVAIRE